MLAREVLSAAKRPVHYQALFGTSPLVVMNGFNNSKVKHLELVQTIVENMFPTINVDTVIFVYYLIVCFVDSIAQNQTDGFNELRCGNGKHRISTLVRF